MKAYFLSDIHLRNQIEPNSQKLLGFLNRLVSDLEGDRYLFLVGDIFDVWVGDSHFFYKRYESIVTTIDSLVQSGWKVVYFEGNHDVQIKKFWSQRGVQVFNSAQYFQIGSLSVRVEHGDYINPEDTAYHSYRDTLKKPFYEWLASVVPGFFWQWAASLAGKQSRKRSGKYRLNNEEKIRSMIRNFASTAFKEKPFDVIITGHVHLKDDFKSEQFRSVNLGSWFNEPGYFEIDSNQSGQFINL